MSKRLVWGDALKGLLMILVIIGHVIQYTECSQYEENHLWNAIYSFHMAAFIAVSGYFSSNGGGILLKRRFLQLMVPYLLWSLIWFLTDKSKHLQDILLAPDRYFWFLWVLFFINVLFSFSRYASEKKKIKEDIAIIAMGFLLIAVMLVTNFRLFGFQFISYYYLFFLFGYMIRKYKNSVNTRNIIYVPLFVLWCLLAWNWNMHALPSWLHISIIPESILQFLYRGMTAFIAVYLLLMCSEKILDKEKNVLSRYIVWMGKYSLCFYTTHLLLVVSMRKMVIGVIPELDGQYALLEPLLFLLLLVVSTIIILILSRNVWLERLFIGKWK